MPIVRRFFFLLLGLGLATPALAQAPSSGSAPAPAQPSAAAAPGGPMYIVSYFETAPAATASAARVLHRFALDTAKSDGNQGVLVLREARRPGRFALAEAWRDRAALDAGLKGIDGLRDHLASQLIAPFDTRPCQPLDIAASPAAAGPRAVYVVTHVDVIPTFKDQTIAAIKELAAASRKEKGNLRFDAVQQPNRLNHLFLIEAYRDRAAFDTHLTAEPTQAFRTRLLPMQGALYDERLYEAVH